MRQLPLIAILAALFASVMPAQLGRRAPGFALPDLKQTEYDLQDYRGKVVILDIMRTDCPHCAPYAKILEEIKTSYAGKVVVLAITNPPDNQTAVAAFLAKNKITFPILFDCGQVAYSYILPNPLRGNQVDIPHTYLIDANGIIRGDWVWGPETYDIFGSGAGLRAQIDKLLGIKH